MWTFFSMSDVIKIDMAKVRQISHYCKSWGDI